MSKRYDITLKQLLGEFEADWMDWLSPRLDLPPESEVDPVDVDLSTIQLAADKAFRLRPPARGLIHIEPQASWDGELSERMMLYNSLLHQKYGGPVYSVALLLRRAANSPAITGTLSRSYPNGHIYHRFDFTVIRVWELPSKPLLTGNPGTIPLGFLTDEAAVDLRKCVEETDSQLRRRRVPAKTRNTVMNCAFILSGLRYNNDQILDAFARIRGVEESTTYQYILERGLKQGLEQGLEQGVLAARQEDLMDILRERFSAVPKKVESRIRKCSDSAKLQAAIRQAVRVSRADDLQL